MQGVDNSDRAAQGLRSVCVPNKPNSAGMQNGESIFASLRKLARYRADVGTHEHHTLQLDPSGAQQDVQKCSLPSAPVKL